MAKLKRSVLDRLNTELEEGWEAKLKPDGRIYYINHKSQTSSWLPPRENWQDASGLPYGWETALDENSKPYFINHLERYTTREDPRLDPEYVEPPMPREVELLRDPEKGFGFVAGSEKPVVVRFVTEGGPSVDQLLPGDQILKINGEEVRRAPRETVIELVRSCRHSITLTVCQPYTDNSNRKSAILTAAKKAKLKNNPSRVRFADAIMVNGASVASQQSPQESYVPFMPNVLKVFLENGQTKSFKYDNKTTVRDVVQSLQDKLNISSAHHFSLMLQNMKSNTPAKMTLVHEDETLSDLAARPGARHFRCLFRVAFVPHDAYDLLKEDPIAFEYFYMQCCNDVIHERFASEMKYDTALRLSALQIQQHAVSNNITGKISIKAIEKESGLDKFVAHSLMENMKPKDLRKMLAQYMKMNQSLTAPGQKQLTALQAKLHYMKIVSELKTFGSRVFMVTLLDQKSEAMVLVGPKAGVSVVTNIKSYTLQQLADFDQIENVKVTKDGENMHRVDMMVKVNNKVETIGLGLLTEDAQNFVSMVSGYYHIFVDRDRSIVERTIGKNTSDPHVPCYEDNHRVLPSLWAYPEDLVTEVLDSEGMGGEGDEKIIDLSQEPPQYEASPEYLERVKNDLGIQAEISIEPLPSMAEPIDLSDVIAMASPGKISNGPAFEEEVTSFGLAANGDDTSSLNSSSSQGTSFRTVVSLNGQSSQLGSRTDLSTPTPPSPISLVTFQASPQGRRGQPVLVAQSESSRPQGLHTSQELIASTTSALTSNKTSNNNANITSVNESYQNSNGAISRTGAPQFERSISESTSVSSETSPLLNNSSDKDSVSPRVSRVANYGIVSAIKLNGSLDVESDDTDSVGTPGSSPAKSRKLTRNPSVESALQSFGLHSPDVIPGADVDFQDLGENVKYSHNGGTVEVFNSVYGSQNIMGQKIYYDPDIIDLTNFPPPETPDDDLALDFTELSNFPPPTFSSNSSLSSLTKGDDKVPPAIPYRSNSSTPNRLERSASTGNCPDFLDVDIDALIAHFTVPPPPSASSDTLSNDGAESDQFANSYNGPFSQAVGENFRHQTADFKDEELSKLIIPPPPSSTEHESEEIPVPLPPDGGDKEKSVSSRRSVSKVFSRHKRSSSLDVTSIRESNEMKDGSESREVKKESNSSKKSISSVSLNSENNTRTPHDSNSDLHGDSPAAVSQKLHELLKSLPNIAPDLARRTSDNWTGSLRIPRSASLDFSGGDPDSTGPRDFTMGSTQDLTSSSVPIFTRSSSMMLKGIWNRPRSQSFDHLNQAGLSQRANSEIINTESSKHSSTGKSGSNKDLDKASGGSESFASLKAKLKDYRDMLLKKNKASASKKGDDSSSLSGSISKGSLKRSGSFSKLMAQFNRRSSKSDGSLSFTSSDDNWELKEAIQDGTTASVEVAAGEKKVPVVRDVLGLNRPTLRPLSSNNLNQQNVYMTYTYPLPSDSQVDELNSLSLGSNIVGYDSDIDVDPDDNEEENGENKEVKVEPESEGEESKARKNGPIKALQSVLGGGAMEDPNNNDVTRQQNGKRHSKKSLHKTKDDTAMTHSQQKEKVKANPYATIKMWRPVDMTTGATTTGHHGGREEDVYHSFTNFDALRLSAAPSQNGHVDQDARGLPITGDLRNSSYTSQPTSAYSRQYSADSEYSPSQSTRPNCAQFSDSPFTVQSGAATGRARLQQSSYNSSTMNGGFEVPAADYPEDNGSGTSSRKVSFKVDDQVTVPGKDPDYSRNHSRAPPPKPPSPPPPPLPKSPPPTAPNPSTSLSPSPSKSSSQPDTSFRVVSDGATNSVKLVLSHKYVDLQSGIEQVNQDVERLLAELKITMDSLKTSRLQKNPAQLSMCLSELRSQTCEFIQAAKQVVSSSASPSAKDGQLLVQLEGAVHTLARLFLHSQACMLLLDSPHRAQHLAFQLIKAANAFRATVSAAAHASTAAGSSGGKTPISGNDPHMKYLMRQATNLASLLAALLNAIKEIQQHTSQ